VLNIALTGGYGSGKSSILGAVEAALPDRTVRISLSSLSEGDVHARGTDEDLNSYIQKEIVKQLLYRERPSRVPGSRYKRISRLPKLRTAAAAVVAGVTLAMVLWIAGWGPTQALRVDGIERLAFLVATGLLAVAATYVCLWLLHNRVRVEKLGTASTSISMVDDASGSYFDEYLDEIVYVFEMTQLDVVIIEDLDRFEDPAIYAALRALNTVLNSSSQLRRRPVHFVYAVRDSIFEDLRKASTPNHKSTNSNADPVEESAEGAVEVTGDFVWQSRLTLSEAPTQRTKFFDLVLPIVPFITHRSSADLLAEVVAAVDVELPPEVLQIVGRHVTDMRLLHNIVNEYRVFFARLIRDGKIEGLKAAVLFGVVTYKNTHLADFELIRVGESRLDKLYQSFRSVIDHSTERVSADIRAMEASTDAPEQPTARAAELGQRLIALATTWAQRLGHHPTHVRLRLQGTDIAASEASAAPFWASVVDDNRPIEVLANSVELFRLSAADLRKDWGDVVPASWKAFESRERHAQMGRLRKELQSLRVADLGSLVRARRTFNKDGETNYRATVYDTLGDPLLFDLVQAGFIDRNFVLYASDFYGVTASANAMNFIVQHVQTDTPSYDYALTEAEVASVIKEGGRNVFASAGLYNRAIYDVLLSKREQRLRRSLAQLALGRPEDRAFIDLYLKDGGRREQFVRDLAGVSADVFQAIDRNPELSEKMKWRLTSEALRGATTRIDYPVPTRIFNLIQERAHLLPALREEGIGTRPLVDVLRHIGARLEKLDGLAARALEAVVEKQTYQLTPPNLRVAAGLDGNAPVGLNTLLEASSEVFAYVIANLPEYLAGLSSESNLFALDGAPAEDETLRILDNAEAALSNGAAEVAFKADPRLRVAAIEGGSAKALEALASVGLFEATFDNVLAYAKTVGIDDSLRDILVHAGKILQLPAEANDRRALAVRLVNDDSLPVHARVSLAQSLTNEPLPLSRISTRAEGIIGGLLASGLLEESAGSFNALAAAPRSQVEFAVASSDPMAYLPSVGLTGEAVGSLLNETALATDAREWLVDRLQDEPGWWLGSTFDALAASLEFNHVSVPPGLAQRAISTDASTVAKVALLVACAPELSAGAIEEQVLRLPSPYRELAERGTKPVDIPHTPDVEPLLEVLSRDGGAVSSWSLDGLKVRVWRRR
jgi:hypothetical protein